LWVRPCVSEAIGGVPPFGHRTHLRIFIDPDLLQWPEVWAAADTRRDVFGVDPHRLVESRGGVVTALKCGCTQSESMIDRAVAMVSSMAELRAAPFG